ncbi:MAG: hypothetical protein HQL91_05395 [Magnetococcales bacterium]|nr:hypothetical protein [Magnetococcales bacterium]
MNRKIFTAIFGVCAFTLSGCASFNQNNAFGPKNLFKDQKVSETVSVEQLSELDLIELIVSVTGEKQKTASPVTGLDHALAFFYEKCTKVGANGGADRTECVGPRNQVQDRIIDAANLRCGNYKMHMQQFKGDISLALASAGTVLGVAGGLATNVATANLFAGGSAAATGINSSFNLEFFADQTVPVIAQGIDTGREEKRNRMDKRKSCPVEEYTLEAAIGDAVEYHKACNMISGLQRVSADAYDANNAKKKKLDLITDVRGKLGAIINGSKGNNAAILGAELRKINDSLENEEKSAKAALGK